MSNVAKTKKGTLRGINEDGLLVFRGIPFARPPVGELRFRPPREADSWEGVRDASAPGPIAPQIPNKVLESLFGRRDKPDEMSEDCLYLNVWTPALDDGRRPVMVWIHGGSFTTGAGSIPLFSGSALASRDVVVVTINYRLGALGFLYLSEFAEDSAGYCANFGLLDQVMALRWVREEIASFGGDPNNVTIFGESAGAASVAMLMASPAASGLFKRAIMQSGVAHNVLTLDDARENMKLFSEVLDERELTPSRLRAIPAQQILEAQRKIEEADAVKIREGHPFGLRFRPVVDGVFLPELPVQSLRRGAARDVATVIGTNADEARLFLLGFPEAQSAPDELAVTAVSYLISKEGDADQARSILCRYKEARENRGEPADTLNSFLAILTDHRFRVPADRLAEAQVSQRAPVFTYRFDWPSPWGNGILGACHALEIPFVFGTQKRLAALVGDGPDVNALAKEMADAWVAFARNGNPSTPSLQWPTFDAESRQTMVLDRECRVERLPHEVERRCWDGIIA
jgi:para-nitrobenzyl esterase